MKKLLILGGATAQVQLIQAAKNERYFVVLCDYTDTNPGIELCDKHYKINYMDANSVLKIAKEEAVDGCISNSEYAMETVSFVCDSLHLNGNSSESLEQLNDKNKFRELQKKLGIFVPKSFITTSFDEAKNCVKEMKFPVIIKPDKSSGSRGTTVVYYLSDFSKYEHDWNVCCEFSRNNKVVVEEFVQMPSLDSIIDGDIFVYDGQILYNGLFTSKRSEKRPMIPMTQSYPVMLDDEHLVRFKTELQKIINGAGITFGELNVEAYYTVNDELFFIEINARQGGNGIPEMILKHSDIDFNRLMVTGAVCDNSYFERVVSEKSCCRFVSRQPLFWTTVSAQKSGCYNGLHISEEIKPYITNIKDVVPFGTKIEPCKNATDCLAWVDLKFENRDLQKIYVDSIETYIYPEIN